ncbi:MAG: tripartite tricarboxylate transporter TctB family protein [Thermodesulfobacteriota bacterium]
MKRHKPMGKWLKCNQGVGVILTSLFAALLIYIQLSPWAHRKLRDGFTLGFFPAVAIVLSIIFSLILIFDSRRKEVPPGLETLTVKSVLATVLAVVVSWLYFMAMKRIGFLIVTPLYLLFAMYVLGSQSWRYSIVVAALMTVIVYGIFRIMGIELPPGMLSGILPF